MELASSLTLMLLLLNRLCVCFPGANLTSSLDRIKIVFTPTTCRRVCSNGRCYNSCEKGDVTTVYSETSHQQQLQQQQPKTTGFRLCECRLQALTRSQISYLVFLSLLLASSLSLVCFLILTHSPYISILGLFFFFTR